MLATVTVVGTTVAVGVTVKVVVTPAFSALTRTTFLVCFLIASSIACLIGSATAVLRRIGSTGELIEKGQDGRIHHVSVQRAKDVPGRDYILTFRDDLRVCELLDGICSSVLEILLSCFHLWNILDRLDGWSTPVIVAPVVAPVAAR